MSRLGRITSALAVGLAGSSLAVIGALPSQAAAPAGWRVVLSRHYPAGAPQESAYSAVVAPRKNDVWVFGTSDTFGRQGTPVAEHWNGARWRSSSLPSGLHGNIVAASASSASDIWVVSDVSGWVLHWNGSRWSVPLRLKETGYFADFTGVTAVSRNDVWLFGGEGGDGLTGLVGFGTWHFNGRKWSHLSPKQPGGNVVQASALSPADMWAGGLNFSTKLFDGISHFNGKTWRDVSIRESIIGGPRYVLAVSGRDVWVDGENAQTSTAQPTLARWNGRSWQKVAVHGPKSADLLYRMTPDGHGGIWMEAESSASGRYWMLHRSGSGRWSSTSLGSARQLGNYVLVPGTRSLWGAGQAFNQGGSDAQIWAYGPIIR